MNEMPKYSNKRKTRKTRRTPRYRTIKDIVPDSHLVKLRYVDQVSLDSSAGSNAQNLFRANSIFDPDYTGVGHQPLAHDQWVPFYEHYTVVGAKCTARFISTDTDPGTGSCMVGIQLQSGTALNVVPTTIMEQPNSSYKVLTGGLAKQTALVSKGFSAKKFFGLTNIKDNRSLVGASQGSNPAEGAFFSVYQAALNAGQNPGLIRVIVTIEYTVLFTERKSLIQS